jgi:plasmid stability protein
MSSLLIRNLDEALRTQLQARAQAHRRSLEEEARETLRTAVAGEATAASQVDIVDLFTRHFGPGGGIDLPSLSAEGDRPPPDFSGSEYDR